jgi:prepilin-type N-terminal cleavage/methylation domain-containing protein
MQKGMRENRGRKQRQARRRRGMTLIEIMAVLVIMGLISTMVGIAILPRIKDARIKATRADAQSIAAAATLYMSDNEGCPTVEQLLEAKILDKNKKTKDAWGHEFLIECDQDGPVAKSSGPDGQMGTEDDIY